MCILLVQNACFSSHNSFRKSYPALSGLSGTAYNLNCTGITIEPVLCKNPVYNIPIGKCIKLLFDFADLQYCFGSLLFHIQQHAYK